MARVVSISADLMLASRVDAALTAAGHHVILARSLPEATVAGADLIVADLEAERPEALGGLGIPVLGYYSHLDADTRRRAEAAGLALVVPRSRMARELPRLAERLLEG